MGRSVDCYANDKDSKFSGKLGGRCYLDLVMGDRKRGVVWFGFGF